MPAIGCARSPGVGSFVAPELGAGGSSALVWQGEVIGTVYRSKNRVAPIIITPGHRLGRESATRLVKACCQGYRLPEPLRQATLILEQARRTLRARDSRDA
jgi:deoxyribonuclease V